MAARRAQRPAPPGTDSRPADHSLTERASEDRPEMWGEAGGSRTSQKRATESERGHAGQDGRARVTRRRDVPSRRDAEIERDRPPHYE